MGYTDRHFRFLYELFFPSFSLFTEMVPIDYVINRTDGKKIKFHNLKNPPICQLGGNDPIKFVEASIKLSQLGFHQVDINCGCPSSKVSEGEFGVVLMNDPIKVASCVRAIKDRVDLDVSVKCRIGIDDNDDYSFLKQFVKTIEEEEVCSVTVHARKALLNGVSPKENRAIPPLKYDYAIRLQEEFPDLPIILNGGINSIEQVQLFEEKVYGIMFGRLAYQDPFTLHRISQHYQKNNFDKDQIKQSMMDYLEREIRCGTTYQKITRHLVNFKKNHPNAKKWRYALINCESPLEASRLIDEMLLVF